jgi:hypothetical protein
LAQSKNTEARSRSQIVRDFLSGQGLQAWLAWRPDELLMMTGHMPYWGASALLYFKDREPVLFVPEIEPRDYVPADLEVREYPWGRLECADPFGVLVEAIRAALEKIGVKTERVGASFGAARTALPMQTAEHNPFPEDFSSRIAEIVANATRRRNPHSWRSIFRRPMRKCSRFGGPIEWRELVCKLSSMGSPLARPRLGRLRWWRLRFMRRSGRMAFSFARMGDGASWAAQRGRGTLQSIFRAAIGGWGLGAD